MITIYTKYKNDSWEYCDQAKDKTELNYLLNEYKLAYGFEFSFKYEVLK